MIGNGIEALLERHTTRATDPFHEPRMTGVPRKPDITGKEVEKTEEEETAESGPSAAKKVDRDIETEKIEPEEDANSDLPTENPLEQEIQIDPEFENLARPLTDEEKLLLQTDVAEHGCLDPLKIWLGHNILLDGHNRYHFCKRLGFSFKTEEIRLPDRNAASKYIIEQQLGRRNVTPDQKSYLQGLRYNEEKQLHGGDRKSKGLGDSPEQTPTDEAIAKECNASARTIRRNGAFAKAVDVIAENFGGKDDCQFLLSEDCKLTRKEVVGLARKSADEQREHLAKARQGGKKPATSRSRGPASTITLPREPVSFAKTLVKKCGRDKAAKLHEALGSVLNSKEESTSTEEPKRQGKKTRKRSANHRKNRDAEK